MTVIVACEMTLPFLLHTESELQGYVLLRFFQINPKTDCLG